MKEENSIKTLRGGKDYKKDKLRERLRGHPFEIATQLRPRNLSKCLEFEQGRRKLTNFYKLDFNEQRKRLSKIGRRIYKFTNPTLKALSETRREVFVPEEQRVLSYYEGPIWVRGLNGITPPLFCGNVVELLGLSRQKNSDILVIGSGEGYSTAFFSEFTGNKANLYGIEINSDTIKKSKNKLQQEGYNNVELIEGNGVKGWKNNQKFDYIWTTLAVNNIPDNWFECLKKEGVIGIFRKLTSQEFEKVKGLKWFPFQEFDKYEQKWWEQVCLETYYKDQNGEIEINDQFYNVFNAPFWDEEYGEKVDINWPEKYGETQRNLVNFLSSRIDKNKL